MAAKNSNKPYKSGSFKRVDNVLNVVMGKLGLERRLKEHTLMNLWPTLIGEPFAGRCRSLFIDSQGCLVVAVADASVGQELSLMKPAIMKKLRLAGQSLGVSISGLRFDLKHFYNQETCEQIAPNAWGLPEPTARDLTELTLSGEELRQLSDLQQGLSQLPNTQDESVRTKQTRIMAVFEQELRIRHWRRHHGYPLCGSCGLPVAALRSGQKLCTPCYLRQE